jgi:hypothetical protein
MPMWRCLAGALVLLIAIPADAARAEPPSNPKSALVAELQQAVKTDDKLARRASPLSRPLLRTKERAHPQQGLVR